MTQRVMIAVALACDSAVIVADEPTTALDVTVQAQIFDLVTRVVAENGCSVVLVTHDLAAVAQSLRPGRRALCRSAHGDR